MVKFTNRPKLLGIRRCSVRCCNLQGLKMLFWGLLMKLEMLSQLRFCACSWVWGLFMTSFWPTVLGSQLALLSSVLTFTSSSALFPCQTFLSFSFFQPILPLDQSQT